MLRTPHASEFHPPLSQRGSPQGKTKFLCRKAKENVCKKTPLAAERHLAARGQKILLFKRGGQKPALAPLALQIPPTCANLRLTLLPISCRTLTYCYRSAAQDSSSETCFLPKSTLRFLTGGVVWAAKFLEHIWGFNFYFQSSNF